MSHWRRWLLVIVVLATLARVAVVVATPHYRPTGDAADYQRHAVSVATGHGFPTTEIATPGTASAFRPPAYPYLLGGVYAVFGVHVLAGRLLGVALGVIAIVLLAYLGRAVWSPRVGLVAGVIGAVYLPLVAIGGSLLSESLLLPLELGFALSLVACARDPGRLRWPVLAGVLCGLAALTRSAADLWILAAVGVIAVSDAGRTRRWRAIAAAVGASVLVVVPWTIRNAVTFHAFVPISTEDGYTAAGQYNTQADQDNRLQAVWRVPSTVETLGPTLLPLYKQPGGYNEVQLDNALRSAALRYLGHHPGHLAVAVVLDTLRLFDIGKGHSFVTGTAYGELGLPRALRTPTTVSAQLIALLALALVLAQLLGFVRIRFGAWWLWAIPLFALAITVPMVGNPLKRAPLDPFLVLLLAAALNTSLDHRRARTSTGRLVASGVADPTTR